MALAPVSISAVSLPTHAAGPPTLPVACLAQAKSCGGVTPPSAVVVPSASAGVGLGSWRDEPGRRPRMRRRPLGHRRCRALVRRGAYRRTHHNPWTAVRPPSRGASSRSAGSRGCTH